MNILATFLAKAFLFILLVGLFTQTLSAQSSDTTRYCIETNDGNKFIGYLETSDSSEFIINTHQYGVLKIGTDEFLGLISIGGRSLINSVSIDYGLFFPVIQDLDIFLAIPWLGFTVPFKKKKK